MSPKQKANELVDKYYNNMLDLRDGYNSSDIYKAAKQCALLAVDEIIKHLYSSEKLNGAGIYFPLVNTSDFWVEVKKELEQL